MASTQLTTATVRVRPHSQWHHPHHQRSTTAPHSVRECLMMVHKLRSVSSQCYLAGKIDRLPQLPPATHSVEIVQWRDESKIYIILGIIKCCGKWALERTCCCCYCCLWREVIMERKLSLALRWLYVVKAMRDEIRYGNHQLAVLLFHMCISDKLKP